MRNKPQECLTIGPPSLRTSGFTNTSQKLANRNIMEYSTEYCQNGATEHVDKLFK